MPVRPTNSFLGYEDFVIACPEFADTDAILVNDALQEASSDLDPNTWGTLLATAHKYRTAMVLAESPMGQNARLLIGDGTSTYEKKYKELLLTVTAGGRVS